MRASSLSFRLAVLFVIAGMAMGIGMAMTQNHALMPAHAHLNLLGWVSLFLFGIYYERRPALDTSRLAMIQVGLWSLGTGFALMRYAAYGGIAAAVVSAIGLVLARPRGRRRGMFRALAGLVIGLIAVGVPWSYARSASAAPPIHDITTDLADPPAVIHVLGDPKRGQGIGRDLRRGAT